MILDCGEMILIPDWFWFRGATHEIESSLIQGNLILILGDMIMIPGKLIPGSRGQKMILVWFQGNKFDSGSLDPDKKLILIPVNLFWSRLFWFREEIDFDSRGLILIPVLLILTQNWFWFYRIRIIPRPPVCIKYFHIIILYY